METTVLSGAVLPAPLKRPKAHILPRTKTIGAIVFGVVLVYFISAIMSSGFLAVRPLIEDTAIQCATTDNICPNPASPTQASVVENPAELMCTEPNQKSSKHSFEYLGLRSISRLRLSQVSAITLSDTESTSISSSLFGSPREIRASAQDLYPYAHPRTVFGRRDWHYLLEQYADSMNFDKIGTWAHFFRTFSIHFGPKAKVITTLAHIRRSGLTELYRARPYANSSNYRIYRQTLAPLAANISLSKSEEMNALFLCALWAAVADLRRTRGFTDFLEHNVTSLCIDATVSWATILLAHRSYHCNPSCPYGGSRKNHAYIWNLSKMWEIHHDWYLGGIGLALAYDVLFTQMTHLERVTVRSALSMIVLKRFSWGTSPFSNLNSPDVLEEPHRSFSNWAGYHAHLYVINLAIEHETDFDSYASSVIQSVGGTGFNTVLDHKYSTLLKEYMKHSFYPDGSTFEDGYSYFFGLREGSIGFLALERREPGLLTSPRFRNIIHNAAQLTEPWYCGDLIGHASGGGNLFNAHIALFRYVYPKGSLPGMLWMQRYGRYFQNMKPCRSLWYQSALHLAILGGEHSSDSESPAQLPSDMMPLFPTAFYTPRRGLLIARSSLRENASYIHFDCRPDAFLVGHDNADRGTFTYSVLQKTWAIDLPWRLNVESEKHSLLHIDKLGESAKAPSCEPLKVEDLGAYVISSANLTYSYNFEWTSAPYAEETFIRHHVSTNSSGASSFSVVEYAEKELNDPWALGWPKDDGASDLGFYKGMKISGEKGIGFSGLWFWKRQFRGRPINHLVRSVLLSKSFDPSDVGIFVLADSVDAGPGAHRFESYIILHEFVSVLASNSKCQHNKCIVGLIHGSGPEQIVLHATSIASNLTYRSERFNRGKNVRLVFESVSEKKEEIWIVWNPHVNELNTFSIDMLSPGPGQNVENGVLRIARKTHNVYLGIDPINHCMKISSPPTKFNDISTMDQQAALSNPPMNPLVLTLSRTRWLNKHRFTSDTEKFFTESFLSHQIVLKIYAVSNPYKGIFDILNTCFNQSYAVVKISVFNCSSSSGGDGYKTRSCVHIRSSDAKDTCQHGSGVRMEMSLLRGKWYYIIVSANFIKGKPKRLVIQHESLHKVRSTVSIAPVTNHSFSLPPMKIRALHEFIGLELISTDLTPHKGEFYSTHGEPKQQIAFSFTGLGNEDEENEDILSTCSNQTNSVVTLTVYDCGDEAEWMSRYNGRNCDIVQSSGENDICNGFRVRLRSRLDLGRKYLLLTSMHSHTDNRLVISHGISPI